MLPFPLHCTGLQLSAYWNISKEPWDLVFEFAMFIFFLGSSSSTPPPVFRPCPTRSRMPLPPPALAASPPLGMPALSPPPKYKGNTEVHRAPPPCLEFIDSTCWKIQVFLSSQTSQQTRMTRERSRQIFTFDIRYGSPPVPDWFTVTNASS